MAKSTPGKLNIINRDKFTSFKPSPLFEYKTKKKINAVRLVMVDHDAEYEKQRKRGQQIDISNPEIFVMVHRNRSMVSFPLDLVLILHKIVRIILVSVNLL